MTVAAEIPNRAGVGLKAQHYDTVLETHPDIGWFEVHAENYMGDGGPPHRYLEKIRRDYPLSLHGVGLSIGGASPLDEDHLARLKSLNDRYEPGLVSEHLAWSSHGGEFFNDLLPLPYTDETLGRVVDHVGRMQDVLERRILLENPSVYVGFEESPIDEIEFLRTIVERTGCGLLLDVNNVLVSASNQGYGPEAYIDAFPVEAVGEIHLAGHAVEQDADGRKLLIDAHDRSVEPRVWSLYRRAIARTGAVPTLIEWDNDVPEWDVLFAEAKAADEAMQQVLGEHNMDERGRDLKEPSHARAF